jgi:DNA-binding transcriptional ArsR family regulator
MANDQDDSFNASQADVFDALGHPTRIRLLQALSERPLAFSELRRAAGLESNGLLTFHLGRLRSLVRLNPEGAYALTDEGREALRIVEASRTPHAETRSSLPVFRHTQYRSVLAGLVAVLVCVALVGSLFGYTYLTASRTVTATTTVTATRTVTTDLISPCNDQVWSASGLSVNSTVPVLLMRPDSTRYICVTYQSAWAGNSSQYASQYSGDTAYRFGLYIVTYNCVSGSTESGCTGGWTPTISHSFGIDASPSLIQLTPYTDFVTVTYTVNAMSNSTGFYDDSAPLGYCGAMPMAVGYAASQVNASDFPGYILPWAIGCYAALLIPSSVSVSGMNVTYVTF